MLCHLHRQTCVGQRLLILVSYIICHERKKLDEISFLKYAGKSYDVDCRVNRSERDLVIFDGQQGFKIVTI